jgi:hypothetical protein
VRFDGGNLDTTFGGGDGIASADLTVRLGANWTSGGQWFAQDPGGRIYGVADMRDATVQGASPHKMIIIRFTRDGVLDPSFGESGYKVLDRAVLAANPSYQPHDVRVIEAGKGATLTPVLRGGAAPVQFAPSEEVRGIDVDRTSGKVTISADAFADRLASFTPDRLTNFIRIRRTDGVQPPAEEMIAQYRKQVADAFKALTGREPSGIPMAVTISVVARDADQQTATQDYTLLLDADPAPIVAKVKQQQEEQRQRRDSLEAQRRMVPAANPPAAGGGGDTAALRQHIAELEKRNQQLEAQVQVLKEMIKDRQASTKD